MPTQPLDVDYYMACLNLRGQRAVVVGAGSVGLEKTQGLLETGAVVTVVAPDACTPIRALADSGAVEWVPRRYASSDLDDAFVVIAATSHTAVNRRVYVDAFARRMLVNVADAPDLCNFILPAVVRRGPIAVAISTSGASPALAKRLKRDVATLLRPSHARLARMLNSVRDWAKENLPTYRDRKEFFESIVESPVDPVRLLDHGHVAEVEALIRTAQETAVARAGREPASRGS